MQTYSLYRKKVVKSAKQFPVRPHNGGDVDIWENSRNNSRKGLQGVDVYDRIRKDKSKRHKETKNADDGPSIRQIDRSGVGIGRGVANMLGTPRNRGVD